MGVCTCIVIYLVTSYDFSFDKFHPDRQRIYRIGCKQEGFDFTSGVIPAAAPAAFKAEIPGIESVTGYFVMWTKISVPEADRTIKKFNCEIEGGNGTGIIVAGPDYFNIFRHDWIAGSASTSLRKPFNVVLTESRARKYFGSIPLDKMIGREVVYDDSLRLSVSGIIADWKENSDFAYTDFISFNTIESSFLKDRWHGMHTNSWDPPPINRWIFSFVKLSQGAKITDIDARLQLMVKKYMLLNADEFRFQIQPLSNIHFNTDYSHEDARKAHLPTLYILTGVALFILILAAINFINLSTAQSIQRAKEIGVRKVLGSSRAALVSQFLGETFVITFLAVCIAVIMVKPVLSLFSDFIPKGVSFHLSNPSVLFFLFLITVCTTLLAGLYPAKVLSSYLPIESLKGQASQKGNGKWFLRKGLIVFQFTISLIFIIGTITIGKQIRYMLNTDFGFKTDAIVTFYTDWRNDHHKINILEERIKQLPGIKEIVLQSNAPGGWGHAFGGISFKGKTEIKFEASMDLGNEKFIPFYDIKLIAGRNIRHSDSLQEFVINETCAKALGFAKPADAIGKFIEHDNKIVPIVGIAGDFHETSFHDPIKPVVIGHIPEREFGMGIKLATKGNQLINAQQTLSAIEKIWKDIYPKDDFHYAFIDDAIASFYETEQKTSKLVRVAMIVTIFISCIGLFGLVMFSAERRTKEIGIRKVLGASILDIASMLSKDFIMLVLTAILIASPIAWYFGNRWLEDFAYRVDMNWWIFISAGVGAVLIALITVSFQAIKAASANPVKSLRTE